VRINQRLVAGLAIVRAHNGWKEGWPVLVTVLGWFAILGGLVLAIGIFLTFQAYGRAER
jgi:hypothetical protein